MNTGFLLIGICTLVILSFIYLIIAQKLRLPAVLLLIGTGVILRSLSAAYEIPIYNVRVPLELLGVIGLVLIVLEGSMDLELRKEKLPLIRRSLWAALLILGTTAGGLTAILHYANNLSWHSAIVYSVPLGIISSAIAIPSVSGLRSEKREFIIYESTFSDILGIMLFNYVISDTLFSIEAAGEFFLGLGGVVTIAIIATTLLMFLLNGIKTHTRFVLLLAYILLVYSATKLLHWPALLMILIMGVVLNNITRIFPDKISKWIHPQKLNTLTRDMKNVTAEAAFLVRTFFFIVFGYSITITDILHHEVVVTGTLITICIIFSRLIFLRFISRTHLFPEFLIAPRGLITVLLFYSIPDTFHTSLFNDGTVLFVIIASNVLMAIGLLFKTGNSVSQLEDLH
jgi:Kef-type K+ transport system membrane component KefB